MPQVRLELPETGVVRRDDGHLKEVPPASGERGLFAGSSPRSGGNGPQESKLPDRVPEARLRRRRGPAGSRGMLRAISLRPDPVPKVGKSKSFLDGGHYKRLRRAHEAGNRRSGGSGMTEHGETGFPLSEGCGSEEFPCISSLCG